MLHVTEFDNRDPRTTTIKNDITVDPIEVFMNLLDNNTEFYGTPETFLNALFAAGMYTLLIACIDGLDASYLDEEKLYFDINEYLG